MCRTQGVFNHMKGFWRARGRILLVALTIWALAMVVPDLYRLAHPLGSFGFAANGDGLVTDVQGPFPDEKASPAWQAGLRRGDRLDLTQMRCIPVNTRRCASALATFGGLQLVEDRRSVDLPIMATEDKPARQIEIIAQTRPFTWWVTAVLPLDQIAAIFVILAAAWLVWTRPGGMTWGFFLYVIWFNPGQSYQYYAWLQTAPAALLAQNLAGAMAQGAGLAGFLLFALRAPQDKSAPRWRPIERALPAVAIVLAILLALASANVFGAPTEAVTRAGILSGFAVAAIALAILLARRREQSPADYQRLRWVIWGCLIGLPSLTLADIAQQTTLLADIWGTASPAEEFWDLIRLVNGVLCLFVFEAVRRPLVVSVAIPLRRVTILGLLLSAPALFLHEQFQHISEGFRENLTIPSWVWLTIAILVLFAISRLHEFATHHADRFFNRAVARAGQDLGSLILQAQDFAAIEAQLASAVCERLALASASVFRKDGAIFRRSAWAGGWDGQSATTLEPDGRMRQSLNALLPFDVRADVAQRNGLPGGLARPVYGVPVANRFECYAIALYGPHAAGANLNEDERATLAQLAALAGDVWTKLDHEALRRRNEALQSEIDRMSTKLAAASSESAGPT